MENYNKLLEIISSFHFGVAEHGNHEYLTIREPIVYKFIDGKISEIVHETKKELLKAEFAVANRNVAYLSELVKGLSDISADTTLKAYEQFTNNLSSRFIKFNGPFITDLTNPVVSELFIRSLGYEIYLRNIIIKELQYSIQMEVVDDVLIKDWYDKERHIQPLADSEIFKLFESGLNQDQKVSASNQSTIHKSNKTDYDFFNDVLNDKGQTIFEKLKQEYRKNEPQRMIYLLAALEKLKLLKISIKTPGGSSWARILKEPFGRKYWPKSMNNNLPRLNSPTNETKDLIQFEVNKINDMFPNSSNVS